MIPLAFHSGWSYADLDNDGDLDIVSNNMETEASIYKNNTNGNFLKVELEGSQIIHLVMVLKSLFIIIDKIQIAENTVTRGYFLCQKNPGYFLV